jgi:excinuclease ABC subunit A
MKESDRNQHIIIKGAKCHNLKNVDVNIPRNQLTVITGPSGSGKSSLAFNTLFAEGQRRYVESLSAYARQFLDKMPPPDVDSIEGIPPAIAIEQKVSVRSSNSTVGTSTEIYDYLKLLYARIGKTFSPVSGKEVKKHSEKDVTDFILQQKSGNTCYLLVKVTLVNGRDLKMQLDIYHSQGYGRILADHVLHKFDGSHDISALKKAENLYLVIDRFAVDQTDADLPGRIADSAYMAFNEGNGQLTVRIIEPQTYNFHDAVFSDKFEADGIVFEKPDVNLFSFHNPYGACRICEGYGTVLGIDEDLVIPDKNLSLYEDAVVCWKGEKLSEWKHHFIQHAHKFNFPVHTPVNELTEEEYQLLWKGNKVLYGIHAFFHYVEAKAYKIQYRVILSRYRGRTICPDCRGTRIRKDASFVKINNHSIIDLVMKPIDELAFFFQQINLTEYEQQVAGRILTEINNRLSFLMNVGLHYLTLNRASNTLSGGETQRINLAQSVGSNLRGALYIIDEPTIGLHPKDTHRLLETLQHLKELGNTIVIVEHEEEIIKAADHIVDMGPLAGTKGGELMFSGTFNELLLNNHSYTADYFNKKLVIPVPQARRKWRNYIELTGVCEHNLQNLDLKLPLDIFTMITGPSGSGKSTLVKKVLVPTLKKLFGGTADKPGKHKSISGDFSKLHGIEFIDQNPIGRSSRSNPATYTKAFDDIRNLFSLQQLSKIRSYKPGFFSFNTTGGRCDRCSGDGFIVVQMQFLADVELVCEECNGKRYKEEALEVQFEGKTITDILDMTVDDAIEFFTSQSRGKFAANIRSILEKLQPLSDIGLGYLKLGQPTSTFSGGEIQRLKLATFLIRGSNDKPLLFVFDEPSTGLHYYDISKLHIAFERLITAGHSLVVIEHNMELIKCADWIIDLGPGGGKYGGKIMFEGTPEDMLECLDSATTEFLREKLRSSTPQ